MNLTSSFVPHEFPTYKAFFSYTSPIFKDMFSTPQPISFETTPEATLPVIDISDTPEDLEVFLHMIYPSWSPTMSTLDEVSHGLVMFNKYQVPYESLNPLRS